MCRSVRVRAQEKEGGGGGGGGSGRLLHIIDEAIDLGRPPQRREANPTKTEHHGKGDPCRRRAPFLSKCAQVKAPQPQSDAPSLG